MGKLEVICGPMFSGKSEELLRRLKRAQIAKQSFILYKPAVDNRYSETHVVTHSGIEMKCHIICSAESLLASVDSVDIIAIDEAQFLDENTPNIVEVLVKNGTRVIVAGLDMDSTGKPFGPIPQLLAKAESILKVAAVCEKCGKDATHTYRHSASHNNNDTILVGASDHYEARCRDHWQNHA
jgi:thymidine kinase